MKKLYERIDDIDIKGEPSQLTEMVTAIDIALQNVAEQTDQLTINLVRYSASNKGTQYEKVADHTIELRDALYEASLELNDIQNQVVDYQNKVSRYDERNEYAAKHHPYLVNINQNINVETKVVQFEKAEMRHVVALLNNYYQTVVFQMRTIIQKKNDIGMIWRDSQYRDFANFIDLVTNRVKDALKEYQEYARYLDGKIKELS